MDLPPEGTRMGLAGHLGTVRFIGKVDNTNGVWLGVEWDDPQRGRHDGVKDGKRYFSCYIHNAGSFIRPSANISYGRSFLDALVSKYIEASHGSESQEKILLGSSHGAIMVEAVRLDKIRRKLASLERLREVSLDNELVAKCDAPGAIRHTCPKVQGLDLSMNLLPSWDVVAAIAAELPSLQRLALNRNRLRPATNINFMRMAFTGLTELQLNGTMMTWREMQEATAVMPKLRYVEMGYNCLGCLSTSDDAFSGNTSIQVVNLDSNMCSDWVHICNSLSHYTSLQRIILTSNCIDAIPFPEPTQQRLYALQHISLSFNKLYSWSDVDAVSSWCPNLETLSLSGNPLMNHEPTQHSRPFTISRIPSLLALDGAAISPRERLDSELYYLSYVAQHGPESEDQRLQAHPQWLNLCKKHGKPELLRGKAFQDKLSTRLICAKLLVLPTGFTDADAALNIYRSLNRPYNLDEVQNSSESLVLRVLPTMRLRTLRMKVSKIMKCEETAILLWVRLDDGTLVDLHTEHDLKELDRLGLENSSNVLVHIKK